MLGILAFGSLISDPGPELGAATENRRGTMTPFLVEFARSSGNRGGAPTLVPVTSGGASVRAVILVLRGPISEVDAASILWRRETQRIGSGRSYVRPTSPGPDRMLVEALTDFEGFAKVFYTDFPESGKIQDPTPALLARLAIASVSAAPLGKDGISYLIAAKADGIETPLAAGYEAEILRQTGALSLEDALARLRAEARSPGR
jgi:hypothetical protein